jgi:nitroreductase
MNAVIDAIKRRRSIRAYRDEPVHRSAVEQVLEAATYAPTASNRQAWRFTAVADAEVLDRFEQAVRAVTERMGAPRPESWRFGFGAPVVVICTLPEDYGAAAWDAGCAGEALFLAAASLGLGTCWFGTISGLSEELEIRELLDEIGVPGDHAIHWCTPLGHPADDKAAPPRKEGTTAIVG